MAQRWLIATTSGGVTLYAGINQHWPIITNNDYRREGAIANNKMRSCTFETRLIQSHDERQEFIVWLGDYLTEQFPGHHWDPAAWNVGDNTGHNVPWFTLIRKRFLLNTVIVKLIFNPKGDRMLVDMLEVARPSYTSGAGNLDTEVPDIFTPLAGKIKHEFGPVNSIEDIASVKTKSFEILKPDMGADPWRGFEKWFNRFFEATFPEQYKDNLFWVEGAPVGQEGVNQYLWFNLDFHHSSVVEINLRPRSDKYLVEIKQLIPPYDNAVDIYTPLIREFEAAFTSDQVTELPEQMLSKPIPKLAASKLVKKRTAGNPGVNRETPPAHYLAILQELIELRPDGTPKTNNEIAKKVGVSVATVKNARTKFIKWGDIKEA